MKLIILLLLLFLPDFTFSESELRVETSNTPKKSILELKHEIKEFNYFQLNSESLNNQEVYFYIGIGSFAGFLASITLFKQEIFSELPLAFFAVGVIFTILGSN